MFFKIIKYEIVILDAVPFLAKETTIAKQLRLLGNNIWVSWLFFYSTM